MTSLAVKSIVVHRQYPYRLAEPPNLPVAAKNGNVSITFMCAPRARLATPGVQNLGSRGLALSNDRCPRTFTGVTVRGQRTTVAKTATSAMII